MGDTQYQVIEATGELKAMPAQPLDREGIRNALIQYKGIQAELDDALPDCVLNLNGKKFRKKSYWRAIAKAFRLKVSIVSEWWDEEKQSYFALARAEALSGDSSDGDGVCSMSEKRGNMATFHNVRSHAITRAKNRAISDLVGFGEVSAEELTDEDRRPAKAKPKPKPKGITAYAEAQKMFTDAELAEGDEALDAMDAAIDDAEADRAKRGLLSTDAVVKLQGEIVRAGLKEPDLLAYLGRESIWSVAQDERAAAWAWIKRGGDA